MELSTWPIKTKKQTYLHEHDKNIQFSIFSILSLSQELALKVVVNPLLTAKALST